ncbi:MAG: hypothetical protein AT710_05310 [Thermocladium sp. ECH_B]|nr:MAG: hypothetical protein AT710_05310 [Thermocladium sp. ECH_B]
MPSSGQFSKNGGRGPRGVVNCPKGHKLHSDLNGALNILKKATGIVISAIKKPLSFIVDHNRVAPLMGRNPLDLGEPSPSRRGRGQSCLPYHYRYADSPWT